MHKCLLPSVISMNLFAHLKYVVYILRFVWLSNCYTEVKRKKEKKKNCYTTVISKA